jgi:putative SOS response-associated peptidase YedK
MHLSSPSHFADCYPLGSITIDFEGAWAQKWAQRKAASLPSRAENLRKIAELFAMHGPVIPDFGPSWNVTPQTFQPIVRLNRDKGEREIVLMRWWLIPYSYWAKDPTIGLRTISAEAETITTAPAFARRSSIAAVWCPRTFYEWALGCEDEAITDGRLFSMCALLTIHEFASSLANWPQLLSK